MAPKVNCNPLKLAKCHAYFQRSGTAHNSKELEKQLVAASGISGMQVKDYLQTLVDENKVRCEKIGSGNWYWSFPSANKISKQKLLDEAQSLHNKVDVLVQDLRSKIIEKATQLEEEEEMLDNPGESRAEVVAAKAELEKELKDLQKELATYSESDPTEVERKKVEAKVWYKEADECSDQINSIEDWYKKQGHHDMVKELQKGLYGDEYDEEEGGLRDLVFTI
ncbi:related to MND1 Mnd1/Hop2 complex promote meiotic chromosome pairing and DSB repair [Ramularia collo-cygni]|uniref:Related to MND1 Mnd1/Hop2 complex promote meiotic chromosome pairing and DSB repair n=1 Tax=Ramularia collo-cygni TaxID=112498 RepID=A0A2D3V6J9_9PEZI|nr:related to MND1 Mnd1/Hop2 complex promote meiotic chromosome pairing and DSB repair [Ramularia collo-cygni]CZT18154.1 related to MND1 Mnd1/Hop2 complex promote meiotic chromosome pairing and DSB repair [Ramularia collo-cygni]